MLMDIGVVAMAVTKHAVNGWGMMRERTSITECMIVPLIKDLGMISPPWSFI